VQNALQSEDTLLTLDCLKQMGVTVDRDGADLTLHGTGGRLQPVTTPIHLVNSGTSMRLLTAVAAVGQGTYLLTGSRRMQQRPIQPLLESLAQLGIHSKTVNDNGCPPVAVTAGPLTGGRVQVDCGVSSQFLSALLLVAPLAEQTIEISVSHGPVSRPYVDVTLDVMKTFGVDVARHGYTRFTVPSGQAYDLTQYAVPPDYSQASYFWAAAAITGADVKVWQTRRDAIQGDVGFIHCLKAMGCAVRFEDDGIAVKGYPLSGITVDMKDMPDVVPTLAVVAAFARGTTVIQNVAHLKEKESDRLTAVATELAKMGIETDCNASDLIIKGGTPRGADIETYNDHRIAMSFAVAGLKTPGVKIRNPECVQKSFPHFWEVFEGLYKKGS
jgi:3-phosphoshikimate 1-carboxyvinyltransferase